MPTVFVRNPDGTPITSNILSEVNSSTVVPTTGAPFVGLFEEILDFASISVTLLTTQSGPHTGTFFFDFSSDSLTVEHTIETPYTTALAFVPLSLRSISKYLRVRYVPNNNLLTMFRLHIVYHRFSSEDISRLFNQTVLPTEAVHMVRAGLVLEDATGMTLANIKQTANRLWVDGPLTDAQLRATPVMVSTQSPVAVAGPLTDAQLRATPVTVSGPLTDAQLRATLVPVAGPLTDAQLRATPVPVTSTPSGAVTGVIFGRVLVSNSNTLTVIRNTTYIEQLANFTGSVKSASASDAAAGTGARSVKITYYDQTGAGPFTETVTLNGTTAVNLVSSNHCFIEKMETVTAGSGATNAGIISLFTGAAGTGTIVGTIATGVGLDGATRWSHHYVPTGKTASINTLNGGTTGNQIGSIHLRVFRPLVSNSFEIQISDSLIIPQPGGFSNRALTNPIMISGFARISAFVISNGTNTHFFSGFDYSEVS